MAIFLKGVTWNLIKVTPFYKEKSLEIKVPTQKRDVKKNTEKESEKEEI